MPEWDEQTVYRQLLARDPAGLDALVDLVAHKAYRLARMAMGGLGSEQDVEEVVSDALAAAWERVEEFDPGRSTLTNWVLMLTKYAALDRRRALRRHNLDAEGQARVIPLSAAPEPTAPPSEELVLAGEEQATLHAALRRLPEAERNLLIRRYFLGESLAEMARDLGLTRGALDTRLWRARQNLKRLLNEESEVRSHER
ncbi:RNA polymerase sigma-70 factor (ECF subfamily) [Symbiobacterium terraclitae]|uniref:RNA polymerase sigma-70 factor (ECF subfamily) n=1 Tax=Symbiobacterium terraclitae TaxID=557451 RepID=A0ABS4JVK9_9FIRM|nr:sigma-70 family RNA polymerase sigma factor [Symbiobacterium terraclitae]MBP2019588.1 RNA polymerase sigma-70 factor (ECF subfamily) [Symbiobacterium terraclitae]